MKIYLASFTENSLIKYIKIFPNAKLNILLSLPLIDSQAMRILISHKRHVNSLILDSGTFTLNFAKQEKLRKSVNFHRFCSFLKQYGHVFDKVFSFDKYFDGKSTSTNMFYHEKLKELGYDTIPVVHNYTGDDLDYFIRKGYKIISLGYSAENEKNKKNIKILSDTAHSYGVKIHALGVTRYDYLADTPVATSDSSSWVQYGVYGMLAFWNENKSGNNKTDIIYFPNKGKRDPKKKGKYYSDYQDRDLLEKYLKDTFNFNYFDLMPDNSIERQIVNIHYYVELQRHITECHRQHGWDFPE